MNFVRSTVTVGSYTVLYRISSIARDVIQAAILGAGPISDAFVTAFKLSNILRKLFVEGSFNASFLPRFSYVLHKNGRQAAERVGSQVLTWLSLGTVILTFIALIWFPYIIKGYAPGYKEGSERYSLAVDLGRICFPYIATSFISALFGGMLNTVNKFTLPVISQFTINIGIILAMVIGALGFPNVSYTMAVGILLAGITQMIILFIAVYRNGFRVQFTTDLFSEDTKEIFRKFIPGAFGAGIWQLNIFIDLLIASFLPAGVVTCFYYADHVNQTPIGILGIALSTTLLPPLAKFIHDHKRDEANNQFNLGFLFALSFTLPIAVAFMLLPSQITSVLYEHGKFGADQVRATAPALAAFALGLPAYVLTKIFSAAFFAERDTKTPFRAGLISVLANVIAVFALMPYLQHVGIALGTTISAWINAGILFSVLQKRKTVNILPASWSALNNQLIAATCMAAVLYGLNNSVEWMYLLGGGIKLLAVSSIIALGVLTFWIVGKLLGAFSLLNEFAKLSSQKAV